MVLSSPNPNRTSRFGSAIAYASDLDADGDPELVSGGASELYVLFTGSSNGTTSRRWSPLRHDASPPFTAARRVASFLTGHVAAAQPNIAPLFFLEHAKGPTGVARPVRHGAKTVTAQRPISSLWSSVSVMPKSVSDAPAKLRNDSYSWRAAAAVAFIGSLAMLALARGICMKRMFRRERLSAVSAEIVRKGDPGGL